MPRNRTMIFVLAILLPFSCFGQGKLFSKEVFDTALRCEKEHPTSFYTAAGSFYGKGDKYGASFLFYLGQLRYRYYVSANPDVKEDGDKAILASLNSVLGDEINFFLGDHFDNYIIVLDSVIAWDKRHDYTFYPKKKDPQAHDDILDGLVKLRAYVIDNKEKLIEAHNKTKEQMKDQK